MRRSIYGLALVATLVFPAAFAQAQDLALDQVPKPVMDAVKARFPDPIKVTAAVKEKDDSGKPIYEINLDDNGSNIDATLSPEGKLVLIEAQIDRKELPDVVAKALEAKFPKARYHMVETVTSVKDTVETLEHYEAVLITPKKEIRGVEVGLDGKILKVEKKASEDED